MITGKNLNREMMMDLLQQGFCRIHFRKSTNGRFRSIFGTLDVKKVPGKYTQSVLKTFKKAEDPNLIPCFDIISGQWKSFYISNVLNVKTEDEMRGKKKKEEEKSKNKK